MIKVEPTKETGLNNKYENIIAAKITVDQQIKFLNFCKRVVKSNNIKIILFIKRILLKIYS